nr:helix-turn-helix domain-containing protein [uncultured Allomuricauda sp.]
MDLGKQLLFFFSALGAFNGLFLSTYFAFFIKNKSRTTHFLAALLFVISVQVTKSVFLMFYPQTSSTFIQIGLTACFLIGPFLYLYTKNAISDRKGRGFLWLIHVLPVILAMIFLGIKYPYREYSHLWQRRYNGIFGIILFAQWSVYVLAAYVLVWNSLKKLFSKKMKTTNAEFWAVTIVICVSIIWLAYNTTQYTSYIVGAFSFSFTFYITLTIWFFKVKKIPVAFSTTEKYADKKIEVKEAEQITQHLNALMRSETLHKNPNMKLKHLAEKLEISPHYLSQLLNDNLGKSFSEYINSWRVETAKELIKNNDQFTLEAIGLEAGFSSKSSFYSTFKKLTGTTPATYKKQVS